MKITVLGSGSAYGTPMIFNAWGNADAGEPKNRRTRASVLLEDKGKTILIDAGPDVRQQINAAAVKNIDAVLLTHGHYDHIAGIPELPRACKILGHGIEVCATKETLTGVRESCGYLFQDGAEAEPNSSDLHWTLLPEKGKFTIQDLDFQTLCFPHHRLHSSAFRYKNFAYVTDWQSLPQGCEEFLGGLDILIIECNNGLLKECNGHSCLEDVLKIRSAYHPRQTFLTHLSARVDYHGLQKELPQNCAPAYDGLTLFLK